MPIKNWTAWRPEFSSGPFNILAYACEFPSQLSVKQISDQTGIGEDSLRAMMTRLKKAGLIEVVEAQPLTKLRPTREGYAYYSRTMRSEGAFL
jgi:predicted ArsR family transcriptional regulator